MSQILTSINLPSHRQLSLRPNIKKIFNVPTIPMSPLSQAINQTSIYTLSGEATNTTKMSHVPDVPNNQPDIRPRQTQLPNPIVANVPGVSECRLVLSTS